MLFDFDTVAHVCNGTLVVPGAPDARAHGLVWDSRLVQPEHIYAALVGERVDGHTFCGDAIKAGASGVLVSNEPSPGVVHVANEQGAAIVQVADTQTAITALAAAWRSQLQGTVLALTGSNGKTTTKNLIYQVLSSAMGCIATHANQNNELGVPATILRADADTQAVVVEMGMRGLGQIAELCTFVQPDRSLVTNVGTGHLELLGTRENIARAKAEIIAGTIPGGIAYMNSSDDFAAQLPLWGMAAQNDITVCYFDGSGTMPESYEEALRPQVYASDIAFDESGCPSFTLNTPKGSAACRLQLPGKVNVHNACAAAAVALDFGMMPNQIADALAAALPEPGRQHIRRSHHGWLVVDDSYNANPDSMCAALDTFAFMRVAGRRIAVLGDMGELGNFEHDGHVLVGTRAASCGLDVLVCVGPLAAIIGKSAIEAGQDPCSVSYVEDAAAVLQLLKNTLAVDDAVLVKASHAVGLSAVVEGLVE